ncbi:unnamed protein product [Mycena citricolor]|uniref:Uncharacterized protein n=1 Tax=Mycena citricolor TaxID=2018698 RepID=A0AAD2H0C7_9AGAR|nr:unnamed protein product [Mycena citricolor]
MVVLLPNAVVSKRSPMLRWPPANRTILIFCLEIVSLPRLNQSIEMRSLTSTPFWRRWTLLLPKGKARNHRRPGFCTKFVDDLFA